VQVDPAALDGQPRAADHHPAAPLTRREHRARPAERTDIVGVEPAAVVQPEVPVAVGPVLALGAGAAQGDREHARDHRRPPGDQLSELLVVDHYTASTAGSTSPCTHHSAWRTLLPLKERVVVQSTETTWNPTTGCDRISPGCDHCYALSLAKRLKAMGQAKYQTDGDPRTSGPGFGVTVHPEALLEPLGLAQAQGRVRRQHGRLLPAMVNGQVPDGGRTHGLLTPRWAFSVVRLTTNDML
jgi:hypothetical protein